MLNHTENPEPPINLEAIKEAVVNLLLLITVGIPADVTGRAELAHAATTLGCEVLEGMQFDTNPDYKNAFDLLLKAEDLLDNSDPVALGIAE